jgi:membrane protein implicated in regulation of membrane protease activity
MQSKARNREPPLPEKRRRNYLGELTAIVATVVIAVVIGIVLDSFLWGFLVVLILSVASLVLMRFWSRQDRHTSELRPQGKSAHAHQHH